MSDINQQVDAEASAARSIAATFMRDVLKLGGAYLMAHGVASSSQVTFWSGLIVIVCSVGWSAGVSWYKHLLLTKARAIANTSPMVASAAKQLNPGASK